MLAELIQKRAALAAEVEALEERLHLERAALAALDSEIESEARPRLWLVEVKFFPRVCNMHPEGGYLEPGVGTSPRRLEASQVEGLKLREFIPESMTLRLIASSPEEAVSLGRSAQLTRYETALATA